MNPTNSDNNTETANNVKKIAPNHLAKVKLLRQKLREKKNKEAEKNSQLQDNGQSSIHNTPINTSNNTSSNNITIILPENEKEKIDPLNFIFSTPSENRKKEDKNPLDKMNNIENDEKKVINPFGNVIINVDNKIKNDIKQNGKKEEAEDIITNVMQNNVNTKKEKIIQEIEENIVQNSQEIILEVKDVKEEPKNNIDEIIEQQKKSNNRENEKIPEKEINKNIPENKIVVQEKQNEENQVNYFNNGNIHQILKAQDKNIIPNINIPPKEEQKNINIENNNIPLKEKENNPEKIINRKEEIKGINNNNEIEIIKEISNINTKLESEIQKPPQLFIEPNKQPIKKSIIPKIVKKSNSDSSSSSDSDDDSFQEGEQQRLMNKKFAQEKLFKKNNQIPGGNIFITKKKEQELSTEDILQKLFLDFDKTSELLELNEKKKQIMLKKMRRTLHRLSNLRIRNVNPQEEEKRNLINKKIEELKKLTGNNYEKIKKNVENIVLELKMPDFYFADDDDVNIIYEKKKISDNGINYIKPILDIDFSSFMRQ